MKKEGEALIEEDDDDSIYMTPEEEEDLNEEMKDLEKSELNKID